MQRIFLASVTLAALVVPAYAVMMQPDMLVHFFDDVGNHGRKFNSDVDYAIRWGNKFGPRNLAELGWRSEDHSWQHFDPAGPSDPTNPGTVGMFNSDVDYAI